MKCNDTIEIPNGEFVSPCHLDIGHKEDHAGYCLGSVARWPNEEKSMSPFKRGDQVVYKMGQQGEEFGFISSIPHPFGAYAFVRYWHKDKPHRLRTKANGELTPVRHLAHCITKPQEEINRILESL